MSQALYRQYRPQRFADVVGQDVAVRTLRNAIEQERVAHAYLFTGTKGTGKTTLAKLLAKAMNCVNGPTVDPCGECDECLAIAEGRSMDVAEIDAASSTGIDSVREKIIDTVAFQPSRGTRRVYIIDEAHQLSKAAFNALLKTIEEPPPHVIFVFCTTETHLMMATVRDRCQRITMRSPGPETLHEVLAKVCEREGITADEAALRAVSRAAQGSFRNALGTLEMLTTTFGATFSREDVLAHLGVVSEEVLFEVADAIIDEDAGTILRLVERLVQDGVDLDQFARSQAEHLRLVLLQLHGLDEHATVGDPARLVAQAARADERRILAAIDCIADAATRMRVGSDPRISLETALVRACQGLGLPLLALRLAALEQRATGSYGAPLTVAADAPAPMTPRPASSPPAPTRAPAATSAPAPTTAPALAPSAVPAPAEPLATATPSVPTQFDDLQFQDVQAWWPQVAKRVAASAAHRPALETLTPEAIQSDRLVVRQSRPAPVTAKLREALLTATYDVTGRRVSLELLEPAAAPVASTAATEPAPSAAPSPAPMRAATPETASVAAPVTPVGDDEGVANLMSMFDATPVVPDDAGE